MSNEFNDEQSKQAKIIVEALKKALVRMMEMTAPELVPDPDDKSVSYVEGLGIDISVDDVRGLSIAASEVGFMLAASFPKMPIMHMALTFSQAEKLADFLHSQCRTQQRPKKDSL